MATANSVKKDLARNLVSVTNNLNNSYDILDLVQLNLDSGDSELCLPLTSEILGYTPRT